MNSDPNDPTLLLRILIRESDKSEQGDFAGKPLWEAILHDFHERGLAGTTVTRAIAGFGATSKIRSILSEYVANDLPILIEVVDNESKILKVVPDLEEMIGGGLVTLEKVEIVLYRSNRKG